MDVIKVEGLSKAFKNNTAVDKIDFTVKSGEIFGFLGPNGAGKTTTINILCTLVKQTSGKAFVNGFDVRSHSDKVRQSIGLVFQDPSLDERLSAFDNLMFHSMLYNVPRADRRNIIAELLDMVELTNRKNDFVKFFSGGMRRRLEIARGLIHCPKILFLDEPTLGLDPQTRSHIWNYIKKLMKEKQTTVFLTTHYMDEAEICDRIAIIDHGKIIALDTPAKLKDMVGGDIISLKSSENEHLVKKIKAVFPNTEPYVTDGEVRLEVNEASKLVPVLIKKLDFEIDYLSVSRPTLDDVFLKLTGREMRDETISGPDIMRTHARMRR